MRKKGKISLYVLELEGGNYYVGMTPSFHARMHDHFKGKGAVWTKKHKPLRIIEREILSFGTSKKREAERLEAIKTITIMKKYGRNKVRGGFFCNQDDVLLLKSLKAHKDLIDLCDALDILNE